jgi:putative peptidoglycan lipid II flippase
LQAQNRAIEFTLLLSIPCVVAFFVIPDLIMRALFMRGAFTAADADAAGRTLTAYAFGLLPFVLIRSAVATFFARGDTATPVKAALLAAAVNIAFKVLLMGSLAQVGLALATSIGAWINLVLVVWFAARAGHASHDKRLRQSIIRLVAAGVVLAVVLWLCNGPVLRWLADWPGPRDLAALAIISAVGAAVYGGIVLTLFGRDWVALIRTKPRR